VLSRASFIDTAIISVNTMLSINRLGEDAFVR